MWAAYEKSKSVANMPKSTCIAESESFLCSVIHSYPVSGIYSDAVLESIQQNVITVNVESAN